MGVNGQSSVENEEEKKRIIRYSFTHSAKGKGRANAIFRCRARFRDTKRSATNHGGRRERGVSGGGKENCLTSHEVDLMQVRLWGNEKNEFYWRYDGEMTKTGREVIKAKRRKTGPLIS